MVQFDQIDQIETAIFNLTRAFSNGLPQCKRVLLEGCLNIVQFDQIDQIETAIFNLTGAFSNGLPQC